MNFQKFNNNKFYVLTLTFTFFACKARSQVVMPTKYDSSVKVNFIRVWEPVKPYTSETDITSSSRSLQEVRQTTNYFDGLGRNIQTVNRKGSLVTGDTAKDMVVPIEYDLYGRETYKFIPFVANNTDGNTSISDGKFKLNPFQQDSTFNKGIFTDESYYYSQAVFEKSPLHRQIESYAPGNNWVGSATQSSEASRRGIKTKFWLNKTADSVRIWKVADMTNSFGSYTCDSIYRDGKLFKNVTQDEHNNQIIEFKDAAGKVILKKVQLTAEADTGVGKNHSGWLCTYYIYDDQNHLRAVIQPKGVELLATNNNWTLTESILDEQCFRYEYDKFNHMIIKKVPGAGAVYMIYDARDRLVMVQDSIRRADHKWLYTVYDDLNRSTSIGLITDNTYFNNAAFHRTQAETSTSYPNVGSYTNEELSKTFYDDYEWRTSEGYPLSNTRNTSYDAYLLTPSDATFPYPQIASSQSNRLKGFSTGAKTKILGTSTYLYSISFFDDKGRVIQLQSTNITGGTDITNNQYSWSGKPVMNILKQEKSGTNSQTTIVLTKPTYDDLLRVIKTEKKISTTKVNSGGMPSTWATISEVEYNALGQIKKKKLGADPLETLNYEYNIRGWMLGLNRDYVKDTTSTSNWFGFDLGYDKTSFTVNGTSHGYTAAQFNGNISGMLWRSTGDDYLRKYDFTYDAVNRFLSADFNQLNSNSFNKTAKIDFSVFGIGYDANGNILSMNQKGVKLRGSETIDSLLYTYNSYSNKLKEVLDRTNDSDGTLGDFKYYQTTKTGTDYTYDGNGSMTRDNNKGLDITYNFLNLPEYISVDLPPGHAYGGGTVTFSYDASGTKLRKEVYESPNYGWFITKTTTYIGDFVYESLDKLAGGNPDPDNYTDRLQFIITEEGRARIKSDSSAIVYDYMVKDHLGNIRMILTDEKDTAFYPPASMETGSATIENMYYANIETTRENKPGDYTDNYTNPNDYAAMLVGGTGSTTVIGPSIALKVMAGDKISIRVSSWWSYGTTPGTPVSPLPQLLQGISTSIGNITSGHGGPSSYELSDILGTGIENFLGGQSYNSNNAKAYVNWIFFDERFNYVSSNSGFEQVGSDGTFTVHTFNNLAMSKSGYLYVCVSNANDDIKVFFDNLQVTHMHGPLIEEDHYYPFGLTMKGISSEALNFGDPENKQKWNKGTELQSKEFSDGNGLELYATQLRSLDPQLGRWWQLDPKPDYSQSLFCAMGNNPILFNDPLGDTLRVRGNDEAKKTFITISNTALGGFYDTKIDENGIVSFVSTGKKGAPTKRQKAYFNHVSSVLDQEKTIDIGLVKDSKKVTIGTYRGGKIDVGDIANVTDGKSISQGALLAHEILEQNAAQRFGLQKQEAHAYGKQVELSITGFMRGKDNTSGLTGNNDGTESGIVVSPRARISSTWGQIHVEQVNVLIYISHNNVTKTEEK